MNESLVDTKWSEDVVIISVVALSWLVVTVGNVWLEDCVVEKEGVCDEKESFTETIFRYFLSE